ncbi:MAG: DNA cytosine methyltransferase [Ruminococcus sp.]|jgi:DNA (cytosine-5)-methyltransferase 1|nr:DNA cytosine methyltransferase [Ruminococcus sp.]
MSKKSNGKLTYISLFSSAGVGCYGFKLNDFECIATNELIERRLNVQQYNNKCKYESGYLCGDITDDAIKARLFAEVAMWKKEEDINDVTTIIATPPCQGMSVANHKKAQNEIIRNSLVIESIKIISKVAPQFFIFENVPQFMKTICTDIDGTEKTIADAINTQLGSSYSIYSQVINFKNYGACSSRSRTLVIGVRNDLADFISPLELFPDYQDEQTLREVIGDMRPLTRLGEIDSTDIYHSFRVYPANMREWISCLKEGESAFDNADINRVPHKIVDGEIVVNKRKNADKYTRQYWDKVGPCIHTRNDQLASQNTIHPSDDRVFSIRELMKMMTIPNNFKWTDIPFDSLNAMSDRDKKTFLKKEEIKIRQCLGEAVPTAIMQGIASKMRFFLTQSHLKTQEVKQLIEKNHLFDYDNLLHFIKNNLANYGLSTLSKIAEYANAMRENYSAFFTDKTILTEITKNLPTIEKETVHILEPSVGTGNFIPFVLKKYCYVKKLVIDVVDIDSNVLTVLKTLLSSVKLPKNLSINYINDDFLLHEFDKHYDLVIGNPPFGKYNGDKNTLHRYLNDCYNNDTTNTASFFIEKAMKISNCVSLVMPKFLLNTPEFAKTREIIERKNVKSIIDFGENGFKGVLVETVNIIIDTIASSSTTVVQSITEKQVVVQKQSYIFDHKYPYWIIYRNNFFDTVAAKLQFNVFNVFRDRQITNKVLSQDSKQIKVVKSRNINDSGTEISSICGYDSYISLSDAQKFSVFKYYKRNDVYLTPNMTYKPRVIKKPSDTLVNGSVAILTLKSGKEISEAQREYFSTNEYRAFYKIARNYQTRSLNVDSCSVFFFGLLQQEESK